MTGKPSWNFLFVVRGLGGGYTIRGMASMSVRV